MVVQSSRKSAFVNTLKHTTRRQELRSPRRRGCQAATAALREAGQEHACALAVFREARAEFLGEEGFFAAGLGVKGKPGDGYGEQAAHFAQGDRRTEEREQNSRVDRMPDGPVGAAANQFVSFLEGDDSAPVGAQMPARPKRDAHAGGGERNTDPRRGIARRNEARTQPPD